MLQRVVSAQTTGRSFSQIDVDGFIAAETIECVGEAQPFGGFRESVAEMATDLLAVRDAAEFEGAAGPGHRVVPVLFVFAVLNQHQRGIEAQGIASPVFEQQFQVDVLLVWGDSDQVLPAGLRLMSDADNRDRESRTGRTGRPFRERTR